MKKYILYITISALYVGTPLHSAAQQKSETRTPLEALRLMKINSQQGIRASVPLLFIGKPNRHTVHLKTTHTTFKSTPSSDSSTAPEHTIKIPAPTQIIEASLKNNVSALQTPADNSSPEEKIALMKRYHDLLKRKNPASEIDEIRSIAQTISTWNLDHRVEAFCVVKKLELKELPVIKTIGRKKNSWKLPPENLQPYSQLSELILECTPQNDTITEYIKTIPDTRLSKWGNSSALEETLAHIFMWNLSQKGVNTISEFEKYHYANIPHFIAQHPYWVRFTKEAYDHVPAHWIKGWSGYYLLMTLFEPTACSNYKMPLNAMISKSPTILATVLKKPSHLNQFEEKQLEHAAAEETVVEKLFRVILTTPEKNSWGFDSLPGNTCNRLEYIMDHVSSASPKLLPKLLVLINDSTTLNSDSKKRFVALLALKEALPSEYPPELKTITLDYLYGAKMKHQTA